jgi:hypothetical protein
MIEVQMAYHHVLDIVRLETNLAQLGVNRHIRGHHGICGFEERAPIARIGNDLVVVPRIEQHIALRMHDHKKAHRYLDVIRGTEVLQNVLRDGQRS